MKGGLNLKKFISGFQEQRVVFPEEDGAVPDDSTGNFKTTIRKDPKTTKVAEGQDDMCDAGASNHGQNSRRKKSKCRKACTGSATDTGSKSGLEEECRNSTHVSTSNSKVRFTTPGGSKVTITTDS